MLLPSVSFIFFKAVLKNTILTTPYTINVSETCYDVWLGNCGTNKKTKAEVEELRFSWDLLK